MMAAMARGEVIEVPSTDGVVVTVHDLGGADGSPPLLFAHATGFHATVWGPLAELVSERFRCFALDFRAHGTSNRPIGPIEWTGMGEDVVAVVDALGLRGCVAVGHSMGGAALLMTEEDSPGTFRAIAAFEPIAFPPDPARDPANNPLSAGARRRRADFASYDEAYANFAGKPPLNALTPAALRAYVEHGFAPTAEGGITLRCRPDDEADVYQGSGAHRTFERLTLVTCPVLVMAGGDDGDVGPGRIAPEIADRLPRGRLVRLPSVGHFGPLEDPPLVASVVLAFLLGEG